MLDLHRLHRIRKNITEELQTAAAGKSSSFPFIRHILPSTSLVTNDETFQVIAIGGSVLKTALCQKHNTNVEILTQKQMALPHLKTDQDLFSTLLPHIEPDITTLAINFAYPVTPVFEQHILDGILLYGSKEHTLEGLIGKHIGSTLAAEIHKQTGRTIRVTLANDTICLLLSGLTQAPAAHLAGGIVGTGVNFALFLDERTPVNLEAGSFYHFPLSEEARFIDQESLSPGTALFEKETAGGYLYKQFNYYVDTHGLPFHHLDSTKALKELSLEHIPHLSRLALSYLEKSAALIACQIAGITSFFEHDMAFVMEGSFYWEGGEYRQFVTDYVNHLCPEYRVEYLKQDNSTLLGAARLVTL